MVIDDLIEIAEKDDTGNERTKTIFMLKNYTVFCIDQVIGEHLNHLRVGHATVSTDHIRYEEADRVIEATGATIHVGGNKAFYDRRGRSDLAAIYVT